MALQGGLKPGSRLEGAYGLVQNVKPEKLFTKERAVKQLLNIIEGVTMETNGGYLAWDGQSIPF